MVRLLLLVAASGTAWAQNVPSPGSGQPPTAQPGGVPALPVANVPNPQQAFAKLPPALQNHLLEWEKRTKSLETLYTECEREVTNTLAKRTAKYTGAIRCMKPNLAYLRIDNAAKKEDFAAYICDGKSVFEYSGLDKTVRQHLIPAGNGAGDNLLLDFMSGKLTAVDIAGRFELKLLKEDQHYIYIEALPTHPRDKQEFDTLIYVLFGPQVKGLEYLPAKVRTTRNNGQEIEEWTFKKPMANPQGIRKEDFVYIAPPKDWQVKPADPKVRP